jgi:hypothetical protein
MNDVSAEESRPKAAGTELVGRPGDRDRREAKLAIYIAVLAALLAIASMIDGNGDQAELAAHLERTNLYNYYQAKNIRSNESLIAAQSFEAMGKADLAGHWRSEYDQHEAGKKKILDDAKHQEALWLEAQRQGSFYKVGVALMQIAIVLASAALVTSGRMLVVASGLLTALGALYMINGLGLLTDWLPTDPAALIGWIGGLLHHAPAVAPPAAAPAPA